MSESYHLMMPENHVIHLPDLALHTLVWGEKGGTVTLALHGWLDNAMTFSGLAPRLHARHFIAMDLPGHGWSDHRPAGCAYHFVDYIADVCAVIGLLREQHGVEQIDLVGHSLGAAISALVAAVIPDQIHHLVLIEGLGPRTREAGEAVAGHQKALHERVNRPRRAARTYPDQHLAVKARQMIGDLSEAAARCLVERNMKAVESGYQWRSDSRLRDSTSLYLTEAIVQAHLREIKASTLVVRATGETAADRQWILDRVPLVPDITLKNLPGTHHLHLEDPQPVADAINEFLQSSE